ncbi:Tyr recombinase domain-containing protein [Paraburkholderia kururiensis]|uniref:hypothetical protein n=1 Tax=Paraburkholderia kururiensis TaxID=984307 RepID=UPI0039A71334
MSTRQFRVPAVTLIWAGNSELERVPVFRDQKLALIEPLVDFCDFKLASYRRNGINRKGYASYVESLTYSMLSYAEYLAEKKIDWKNEQSRFNLDILLKPVRTVEQFDKPVAHWLDANDTLLQNYGEWALQRIRDNPRSRHSMRKAMATANRKLEWVYEFYCWAQMDAKYASNLMSWDDDKCNIRSSLPSLRVSQTDANVKASAKYPVRFTHTGERSRTKEGQHWATPDEIRQLAHHFRENFDSVLAERNVLLLHLGEHVGWRCESANSLTVDLFSDEAIESQFKAGKDHFLVVPPKQKNYHQFSFPVPWELAYRIHAYIEDSNTGRAAILNAAKGSEKDTAGRIFLSRRGTFLTDRSLSQLFGKAFRAIGAPKGAGYHALRRGMLDDFADRALEARHLAGASVAKDDVLQDIMDVSGHVSGNSYQAYVRSSRRRKKLSIVEKQQAEICAREAEKEQSLMEAAVLRDVIRRRGPVPK